MNSHDVKNFTQLKDLIENNSNEIVLDSDFIIDDSEKETFKNGIRISREITIDGRGHTIDARNKARIFDMVSPNAALKNIIFKNGDTKGSGGAILNKMVLSIAGCEFTGCICDGLYGGGAIFNGDGFLIIDNCRFCYNLAFDDYSGAGAVSNAGKAIIMDSVFKENKSLGDYGGGAIVNSKSMKITNCKFLENHAEYRGGAISNDKGDLTVDKCEFFDNSASGGGAVFSNNSSLAMSGCTYARNTPNNVSK